MKIVDRTKKITLNKDWHYETAYYNFYNSSNVNEIKIAGEINLPYDEKNHEWISDTLHKKLEEFIQEYSKLKAEECKSK